MIPFLLCLVVLGLAISPEVAGAGFTEVGQLPEADPGPSRSVAWADVDGDGRPDLFVAADGPDRLLLNRPTGFLDVTAGPLVELGSTHGAVFGDVDNDGDPDLYVFKNGLANLLLRNDGGVWVDITHGTLGDSGNSHCAAFADADRDGDLDLYLSSYDGANRLWRNDGSSFVEITPAGLDNPDPGASVGWVDYDDDGDPDLFLVVDGASNRLFRNDGGMQFVDVTGPALADPAGRGYGASWADYDNDGDLDVYLTNLTSPNRLVRNEGNGVFTDVSAPPLDDWRRGYAAAWGDYDRDGDQDLYLAIRWEPNKLFRNDGGSWTEVIPASPSDPGTGWGAAWTDYDLDGDLDLYLANHDTHNRLYRNDGSGGHWLHLDLVGVASNRDAVGARVWITADGESQLREIAAGAGNGCQDDATVEFGLGDSSAVEEVRIVWPSGAEQLLGPLAADQRITVMEPMVVGAPPARGRSIVHGSFPNPTDRSTTIWFDLPAPASLELEIVDLRGRRVRTLSVGRRPAGRHQLPWDGRDAAGRPVAAARYSYRALVSGEPVVGSFSVVR